MSSGPFKRQNGPAAVKTSQPGASTRLEVPTCSSVRLDHTHMPKRGRLTQAWGGIASPIRPGLSDAEYVAVRPTVARPIPLQYRTCLPAPLRPSGLSELQVKSVSESRRPLHAGLGLYMSCPPDTSTIAPVMKLERSEARKRQALASSSGSPMRLSGITSMNLLITLPLHEGTRWARGVVGDGGVKRWLTWISPGGAHRE